MSTHHEDGSKSSPFQNGTDQQDGRAAHDESAPHIPHDQLVTHFRRYIAQEKERNRTRGFDTSPEYIIRSKLDWESGPAHTDPRTHSRAFDFWQPLISAWDAVAYDRYDPDSLYKTLATCRLSSAYELTRLSPQRKPVIQLNRYQAGIIDALTEAAGATGRSQPVILEVFATGPW